MTYLVLQIDSSDVTVIDMAWIERLVKDGHAVWAERVGEVVEGGGHSQQLVVGLHTLELKLIIQTKRLT